VLISMVEHRRIRRLQADEEALLIGAVARPGLDVVVPSRQSCRRRHNAHGLLAGDAALSLCIPAVLEDLIVALDEVEGGLMRRMARRQREP